MSRSRITWLATLVCLAAVVEVAPESAGCANTGPSVLTDKSEYRAGDTVSISGCGFGYKEPVSIVVTGPDGTVRSANAQGKAGKYEWIADENGAFTVRFELEPRQTARAKDSGRYQVSVMTGAGLPLASTEFLSIASSSTDSPDFFWLPPTVPTAAPFTGPLRRRRARRAGGRSLPARRRRPLYRRPAAGTLRRQQQPDAGATSSSILPASSTHCSG